MDILLTVNPSNLSSITWNDSRINSYKSTKYNVKWYFCWRLGGMKALQGVRDICKWFITWQIQQLLRGWIGGMLQSRHFSPLLCDCHAFMSVTVTSFLHFYGTDTHVLYSSWIPWKNQPHLELFSIPENLRWQEIPFSQRAPWAHEHHYLDYQGEIMSSVLEIHNNP